MHCPDVKYGAMPTNYIDQKIEGGYKMPTIIDPSKPIKEQLADISKNTISLRDQVSPKFFHSAFTGSGKRMNGHFNKDYDTIKTYTNKRSSNIREVSAALLNVDSRISETADTNIVFIKKPKENDTVFKQFATVPTTGILPRDFVIDSSILAKNEFSIEVPANTSFMNIAVATIDWKEIQSDVDMVTVVSPYIESMSLYEKQVPNASTKKNETVIIGLPVLGYSLLSYHKDMDIHTAKVMITNKPTVPTKDLAVMTIHTMPLVFKTSNTVDVEKTKLEKALIQHLSKTNAIITNKTIDLLHETLMDSSLSEMLTDQASVIHHSFESQTKDIMKGLLEYGSKNQNAVTEVTTVLARIVHMFDCVNDLDASAVSTTFLAEAYDLMYNHVHWLGQTNLNTIVKQSLRMLLSQRLHELDLLVKNDQLYKFKNQDTAILDKFNKDSNYSSQQKRIITSEAPLVIGQAGAGSGKTHTLTGRLRYLKENNEDLSKVLILSFTNVAAAVVTNRTPGVRSETLANMFNTIYMNTYPLQRLSQPSTVANSISLLEPTSPMFSQHGYSADEVSNYIKEFTKAVRAFDQTGYSKVDLPQVTRVVSNLIEQNLELTELLLDAIEQSTLELQPIIIHHHLLNNNNNLAIPKDYQELNYIITDESQDISTFEYILLLELTIHYKSQLLVIGDGSQTLYEFRNSDPRYMNALEASGIFTAYKLDVNYRSNQEILMMANQFLEVIEANDYANIRLSANSFRTPSLNSFNSIVKLDNLLLSDGKPASYGEELKNYMLKDDKFRDWVTPKLQNGEQVAILGWTRAEVLSAGEAMAQLIKELNLNIEVTNILSDNERPSTIISDTIVKAKNELYSLPFTTTGYVYQIKNILEKAVSERYRKATPKQLNYFNSVIRRAVDEVINTQVWKALVSDVAAKNVNKNALLGHLTREMLRIETRKNATDQYLRKNNEVPDYDNSKVIISTIHGAKGLEFEHTIVLFNESKKGSTNQESLRMQFVALSRAKKSEYIINACIERRFSNRVVSSNLSSMFVTPMETAYMRTEDQIVKIIQPSTTTTALADDDTDDVEE